MKFYFVIVVLCVLSGSVKSAPYPITLESVIHDSDKIAVFDVIEVEYVKKDMAFNTTSRSGEAASYHSKMMLTKYSMEVDQAIKNTVQNDIYEIYSDGGIDIEAGEGVRSSVGFNLSVGEKVLVMIEYDQANNIYMPIFQNSTVFKLDLENGETILTPYSDITYYKSDVDTEGLISGSRSFNENMLIKKITLENVVGLIND